MTETTLLLSIRTIINMLCCIKNDYGTIDLPMELGPARWPHFDLIFVHSGAIKLNLPGNTIKVDHGQAILLYPETAFHGRATTPEARISVHHFSLGEKQSLPPSLASLSGKTSGCEKHAPGGETSVLEQDIERAVALAHESGIHKSSEERSLVMTLILSRLRTLERETTPRRIISPEIQKLVEWLQENLAEEIPLERMAARVGLSTNHFGAVFKKQTGVSPGNYLLDLRSREVCRLLRETLVPIKQIASLAGYKDLAHLYHAFKLRHKTTPKAYRDRHTVRG